jgi:iron complex outermembrane receptor protein
LTQLSLLEADTDYGYDEDWGYVGLHPDEYSSTDQYLRERDFMSLEQRFISKNQQGHNWVAGLYASQQTIDLTRLYTWLDQNFISDFERQNLAIYAENEQQLAPDLTLTYGGRLEQYQDEYTDNNGIRTDGDDQMWGGKLSLAYQVSPLSQIYGLVSKGYKVGGVNGEALAETLNPKLTGLKDFLLGKATFAPEQLINTEFGVKGQNADQTLVSRVSAFYMWRDDMQLKAWINQGTKFVGYIDNAFSGRNYGLETENRWQLTPVLVAHFSGAVLKSEIRGFVTKAGLDMSGRSQAQAPQYQFSVGADWSPLEALQISAQFAHKDGYYYSDSENIRASHSNLLNLRASYQWSQWELALWSRNLLDETYGVRGFYFGNDPRDGYTDHLYEQFGEPRRIGLTATYQF